MKKRCNTALIKRTITDWFKVLVLLLDEAAALVVIILLFRFFHITIPLPVTVILGLLAGVLIFMLHKAVIPSFHRKIITGSEGMLGKRGRVVKSLNPTGTIVIENEHWRAKSTDSSIDVEENVEIVAVDGLTLQVKRTHRSDTE